MPRNGLGCLLKRIFPTRSWGEGAAYDLAREGRRFLRPEKKCCGAAVHGDPRRPRGKDGRTVPSDLPPRPRGRHPVGRISQRDGQSPVRPLLFSRRLSERPPRLQAGADRLQPHRDDRLRDRHPLPPLARRSRRRRLFPLLVGPLPPRNDEPRLPGAPAGRSGRWGCRSIRSSGGSRWPWDRSSAAS